MNICGFWQDVLRQNKAALPDYFHEDAVIRWHCSNEQFTVKEYILANCEYPGDWDGEIERMERWGSTVVLAGRVFQKDRKASYHVVSFIELNHEDKIEKLDEYWSDNGSAPAWRKALKIGKPIKRQG